MEHETRQSFASQEVLDRVRPLFTPAQHDGGAPCPTCAGVSSVSANYVYALGKIEARFPRLSVEKEFAQAIGRIDTAGQTDQEAFYTTLTQPQNRYLVRQLCWVLTVQGLETFILLPRDPGDFEQLVAAIRSQPSPLDIDVVIGVRGPTSPPDLCNGLIVPIVACDQIYSFDRSTLVRAIPRPEKMAVDRFEAAATEVVDRVMLMTDDAGTTDDHRALNYVAVRYPGVYARVAEAFADGFSLNRVEVHPSRLSSTRTILDVILSFTNRSTDFTEKSFVRVDVTEEFPFLVTKLSPYYDR